MTECPREKQNILRVMGRLRGMDDIGWLQHLVAYHAAPTLLGIKPATLICPGDSRRDLDAALAVCGPRFEKEFGVRTAQFRNCAGAPLLLVYCPCLLRMALAAGEVTELLAEAGYDTAAASVEALLGRLREKCAGADFPHEIGVFLGYPPADVRQFMRRGGRGCRGVGCWKAYGDVQGALDRSASFGRARMRAAELIAGGADFDGVAAGLREAV